VLGPAMLKY